MKINDVCFEKTDKDGTIVYVAVDKKYISYIMIADRLKPDT